ncbi:MAG: formylmethanofuran dehydrogenase subunit A [Candidatus Hydrothermarchaeota archaeon]|nr:MAG: formylmethanofuran dehydrogenase subunit A [Candidatus Hydrothermarchaeota archaeon]
MKLVLKNGIVYDPINGINGEKMDIFIKNGRIVDKIRFGAKVIDVSNKLVLAGGLDIHSHISGGKVNSGRLFRPEDSLRKIFPKKTNLRSGTGYSVPSTFLTGYEYARLGYTFVVSPAMPPLLARHTHHELNDIPLIDKATLPLFDGNWFVMKYIKEKDEEKLKSYVAWLLKATKGFSVKLTNPGGTEAWGWGKNIEDIDEEVPYFNVTPREIIESLVKACEALNLPHSVHLHCNNLGNPGNYETTIKTFEIVKGMQRKSRQVLYATHVQFHSYGGDTWKTFESKAEKIARHVNKNDNIIIDTGNVIFGDTTTMTADGPLEFHLHVLTRLKWMNRNVELETSPGVTPFIYSPKSPVNAIQWAIGIELALLIDPDKIIITTDHPNGGVFTDYPKILTWLMSKEYREATISNVNNAVEKRAIISALDKEYDFYEIAKVTRANPAKAIGLEKIKGHLGEGAHADIAVYDLNPLEVDSKDYEKIEKALSRAFLTIKEGEIIYKEGEVTKHFIGRTYWVNAKVDEELIKNDLDYYFKRFYSVNLANYVVNEKELARGKEICVK